MVTLTNPQQVAKYPAGTIHQRNFNVHKHKNIPLLKTLHKLMIAQTMYTLTGHGPYLAHHVKQLSLHVQNVVL